VIAYEKLFSKIGDSSDSVSHKLACRCSRLIEQDFKKRMDLYEKMKDLYSERNNIVHGTIKRRKVNINSSVELERNVRNSITKYIKKMDRKNHDHISMIQ
jgi:hypothetical protein